MRQGDGRPLPADPRRSVGVDVTFVCDLRSVGEHTRLAYGVRRRVAATRLTVLAGQVFRRDAPFAAWPPPDEDACVPPEMPDAAISSVLLVACMRGALAQNGLVAGKHSFTAFLS